MQLKNLIKKTSLLLLIPLSALMFNCGGSANADGNSGNAITNAAKDLGNKTKEMAKDAGDMAKDAGNMVKDAGGDMADGMKKAGEGIADAADDMANSAKDAGSKMMDKADDMKDKVANAGSKMKDKMKDSGAKMMDKTEGMKDKMKDGSAKMMDKAEGMKDKMANAGSTMKDKVVNATSRPAASQPAVKKAKSMENKAMDKKADVMPAKEMPAKKMMGVDHKPFDALLRKHVSNSGSVNYAGFKSDISKLDAYLANLSSNPVQSSWSRNEKLAYWINAYNANTIKLIVNNYPLAKITDLEGGKPWDKKWIKLGDKTYSLNNIENDIIRPQFNEPRIHFAVNCAAKSCPTLMNKAWFPNSLESDFEKMTTAFINNSSYNSISSNGASLSKIFEWYGEDFGDVKAFVNKYANTKIGAGTALKFMDYDWNLNGK